jgi:hypothetical protein
MRQTLSATGQTVGKRWRFHQDIIDEWVKSGTDTVVSHKSGRNASGDRA